MTERQIPVPVLVTGAGGLIGSAVVGELASRGIPTRAMLGPLDKDTDIRNKTSVLVLNADVREQASLTGAMAGCKSVVHCAALNKLWHRPAGDFYQVNVDGTRSVLEEASKAGVERFVFVSSCEVMGPALPGPPADETRPLDARRVKGHYEMSKFISERLALAYAAKGMDVVAIRPTAVVGPNDRHGTPPGKLIRACLMGEIKAYYDAGINVVDSRDVAAACVAALATTKSGEVYIVGGHNITISELFSRIAEASGVPPPARRVGYAAALAAAYLNSIASFFTGKNPGITVSGIRTVRHPWHFNCDKARRELGHTPRPLGETVRDAVEWYYEG